MLQSYAEQYRRLWQKHWWWQSRKHFVWKYLTRLNRRQRFDRILDIGCGDGLFFNELSKFGEVEGIEPDASLLSADGKWRSLIHNAMFNADFKYSKKVDLILMLDVLEHIEDDMAALRQARSLLSPNGILFLTVPALPSLWSLHDVVNLHFRRYTKSALRQRLMEAGFEPLRVKFYFGWTVVPMFLLRMVATASTSEKAKESHSVTIPPTPVNRFFYLLTLAEQLFFGRIGKPIGSSLFAAARNPTTAGN